MLLFVASAFQISFAQSEKSYSNANFTGIQATFSGTVNVTPGDFNIVAIAKSETLEYLSIENDGSTLEIGFRRGAPNNLGKVIVNITMPKYNDANLTGSGQLNFSGFDRQGKGNLKLSGSGNVNVNNDFEQIVAKITGSGNINVDGKANELSVSMTGSGNFNGEKIHSETASVSMVGSGNINVGHTKTCNAKVVGSGNLKVNKEAEINASVMGSGRVIEQ